MGILKALSKNTHSVRDSQTWNPLESIAEGFCGNKQLKPFARNLTGFMGRPRNRDPLGNATSGFDRNASQNKFLERTKQGFDWKPHNRTPS
eukprot:833269-Pyramimonas_sp.AAC.1